MKKGTSKKIFRFPKKILKATILGFLDGALTPHKKHKPTQHEIMCGEKLPFTGKYYTD